MIDKNRYREKMQQLNCCVLIPTYNNDTKLKTVIDDVLQYTDAIIVVNDGSTDTTETILNNYPVIEKLSYTPNRGKGRALRQGFKRALELGYDYAITIDSDGQHKADDLPAFIDALEQHPGALIVGSRNMTQEGVPSTSSFGHNFSNFWYRLETGIKLPDTQSGYRLYPLKAMAEIKFYTTKYEFELEALVKAAWKGLEVIPIPINVIYPDDRITHFRMVRDFTRISLLNTVFVTWLFIYIIPIRFFSNFKKEKRRDFFRKNVLMSTETNGKIVAAAMIGLFIGVAPIWGYQILAGIAVAHLFKLNKVLVVASSHISIPPMIPIIIYASFKVGGIILDKHQAITFNSGMNIESITDNVFQYVVGSIALGVILAICIGLALAVILMLVRKKPIKQTER